MTFVDADDWIEPQTFEHFINFMDANVEVDICMCNGFAEELLGTERVLFSSITDFKILDIKTALEFIFDTRFDANRRDIWAKIYRYTIARNLKLDESLHMGENWLATWHLMKNARSMGFIPYKGYHYRMNPLGLSLQNNNVNDPKYPYDWLKYAVKFYEDRGLEESTQILITKNMLDMAITQLVRLFNTVKMEIKASELEYPLNVLMKNKDNILNAVALNPVQKKLIDALAQPFDKAQAGCRKIYFDFLADMKNFCETYDEIFIYGAGHFGVEVGGWLNKMNCPDYKFLTSKLNGNSNNRLKVADVEKEIIELSKLFSPPDKTGIILAMNPKNIKEVVPNLNLRGYTNIFDANKLGVHL